MKGVLLSLGMGSCVSSGDQRSDGPHSSMRIIKGSSASSKSNSTVGRAIISVQTPVIEAAGTKEEMFFDSKPWLDSDDEDFVSVNGDMSMMSSPVKQVNGNGDHVQGRRLSELFLDSSFGSDSQTSLKAKADANCQYQKSSVTTKSTDRKKSDSGRSSANHRCLPSLVRTLSCGDRRRVLK